MFKDLNLGQEVQMLREALAKAPLSPRPEEAPEPEVEILQEVGELVFTGERFSDINLSGEGSSDPERSGDNVDADPMETYYDLLGVDTNAIAEEIKRAYIKLSREYDTDLYVRDEKGHVLTAKDDRGNAINVVKEDVQEKIVKLNAAYEILGDTNARAQYDTKMGIASDGSGNTNPESEAPSTLALSGIPLALDSVVIDAPLSVGGFSEESIEKGREIFEELYSGDGEEADAGDAGDTGGYRDQEDNSTNRNTREPKKSGSHYDILGVGPNATEAEIKAAYRKMANQYHPDRFRTKDNRDNISKEDNEYFQKINAAYEILGDANARAQYDARMPMSWEEKTASANQGTSHNPGSPSVGPSNTQEPGTFILSGTTVDSTPAPVPVPVPVPEQKPEQRSEVPEISVFNDYSNNKKEEEEEQEDDNNSKTNAKEKGSPSIVDEGSKKKTLEESFKAHIEKEKKRAQDKASTLASRYDLEATEIILRAGGEMASNSSLESTALYLKKLKEQKAKNNDRNAKRTPTLTGPKTRK
jgi:DnaJ-class molecular chaperone